MAWAGNVFTSSNLPAPKYWDIMADMALLVCPNIHISIDKNDPTIPAAAKDSNPSTEMLPTMAVSVIERMGSAIPAIVAGKAKLLIVLKLTAVFNVGSRVYNTNS